MIKLLKPINHLGGLIEAGKVISLGAEEGKLVKFGAAEYHSPQKQETAPSASPNVRKNPVELEVREEKPIEQKAEKTINKLTQSHQAGRKGRK